MNWARILTVFSLALAGTGYICILARKMKETTGVEAVDQATSSQATFGILMIILVTVTLMLAAIGGPP